MTSITKNPGCDMAPRAANLWRLEGRHRVDMDEVVAFVAHLSALSGSCEYELAKQAGDLQMPRGIVGYRLYDGRDGSWICSTMRTKREAAPLFAKDVPLSLGYAPMRWVIEWGAVEAAPMTDTALLDLVIHARLNEVASAGTAAI